MIGYFLAKFFSKPERVVVVEPSKEQQHFLHGFDMREWNYLGYSEISYTYDADKNSRYSANVYFFSLKTDDKVRNYTIRHHHTSTALNFGNHIWVTSVADPWKANQTPWYDPIKTWTSKYTRDRMLLDFDCVWDEKNNWWIRATEQEKYNESMKKQRKTKKEANTIITENIVKVDFNTKNNEDA